MEKTIEYILEVAHCRGISKAAQNLYITPSALSKFIIQKEKTLGIQLFHRNGKTLHLTEAGEKYVQMLEELRTTQLRIDREMASLAAQQQGHLRIGFQSSYAELMTHHVIPLLQRKHPDLQVTLEENHWWKLEQMLLNNQLDVVLTLTDQTLPDTLQEHIICSTPIIIAAGEDMQLDSKAEERLDFAYPWLSNDVLCSLPWILDTDARSLRRYAPSLYDSSLKTCVSVRSSRTALMCVEQNMGIIAIPEFLADQAYSHPSIRYYSFGNVQQWMNLSVIHSINNHRTQIIKEFTDVISSLI